MALREAIIAANTDTSVDGSTAGSGPLGAGGQIAVQCDMPPGSGGTTHLVLDVYGYLQ